MKPPAFPHPKPLQKFRSHFFDHGLLSRPSTICRQHKHSEPHCHTVCPVVLIMWHYPRLSEAVAMRCNAPVCMLQCSPCGPPAGGNYKCVTVSVKDPSPLPTSFQRLDDSDWSAEESNQEKNQHSL